ncbi:MAG: hypothetical protein EOM84_02395 [Sphingobacteriia bacterium]|nr:hypothetical protein [Sphingobacteriia bacterium]
MKVSFLMMPFSVIVSIFIIIWHIYPAWMGDGVDSIKKNRAEIKELEDEISKIENRKSNISKLGVFLNSDDEFKNLVQNYYSTSRNDEDIINSINNIAFNEGIYLEDMDLEYVDLRDNEDPIVSMSLQKVEPIKIPQVETVGNLEGVDSPVIATTINKSLNSKIKYIEVSLKTSGTYEQIKVFLKALNSVGILNKVQYFKINTRSGNQNSDEKKEFTNEDTLEALIKVGFGYYVESKEGAENLLYSKVFDSSQFNLSALEEKEDILRGIYYKTEVNEVGSSNPFVKSQD